MATIDSLAPELLSEIFGHLPHLFGQKRYRDLYRASLVCRRWREPTQRLIFQTVELRSQRQADLWLQSRARTRYHTRTLTFGAEESYWDEVLTACPGLSSLTLGAAGAGGHDLCVGRGLDLKGLTSLSIRFPERFPSNPTPLAFPNLCHLELALDGGSKEVLGSATLREILLPSRHTLTTLRLVSLRSDVIATHLVEVLSSGEPFQHVRHLVIRDTWESFETLYQILLSLPSLATLELVESHDIRALAALDASSLPTLQNIVLPSIRKDEASMAELIRVIKVPTQAGLRRLEMPIVPKDELAGATGLALLDVCEDQSISLLCRYGYLTRDMMEEASPPRN